MPRTCKQCKIKFEPTYSSVQPVCSPKCAYEYSKKKDKKVREDSWKKQKKAIKEKLKTNSDYVKELQTVVNRWVRLRDEGLDCISCGNPAKKENAGHYRSAGGNPELRFEPLNVHLQCEHCNTYLHGNLINYRINLIKKIGIRKVEWLEGNHDPSKISILRLIELKVIYKDKIKDLKE